MTFIQHSLMETHQVSLGSPVKQSDTEDGFESVLDAIVLQETAPSIEANPLDLNNLIEGDADDLLTLDSDSCVIEQQLPMPSIDVMMIETAPSEEIQRAPTDLMHEMYEHIQKAPPVGIPSLKKLNLKKLKIDGTEVDGSMMIPVPIEKLPNPVALIQFEIKRGGESLHPAPKNVDSQKSIELQSQDDAMLMKDVPIVSIASQESNIDLATIKLQSQDDAMLMKDVPIVSIALKCDPVLRSMPIKKSNSDLEPQNESLTVDQTAVSKPKIFDEVTEVVKPTESKKESLKLDSEEIELLLESTVTEEVNLKTAPTPVPTESSDVSTEVNISRSAPTQQIQQAILEAKEEGEAKESKTLTVVLNPEELGTVNVELKSDETGKLHAVLSVEKRETLDVLQHDLHQLKTVLKEIGIDESNISLQLSSNNEHGQQKQSEYVAWEEREQMLMRFQQSPLKAAVEKASYPERQSLRRLDIKV